MEEKNNKKLNVEKKSKSKPKTTTVISIVYLLVLILLVVQVGKTESSEWAVLTQLALMFWGFILYVIIMTIYGIFKK